MLCTKHSIGRINSIHERCLRLIQQNYTSDFEVLLENANEKQVHQKCIELLMIEVYKYLNGLSPDIMNDIFKGYLRYKTITSQNVSSDAQVKKFFISQKVLFRSQDIQVFVFLTIPLFNKPVTS